MKVSARNQFTGIINEIREGVVNAEVIIALPGNEIIVAAINRVGRYLAAQGRQ